MKSRSVGIIIRLRLLKQRNFGFGTISVTLLGFALFA